MVQHDRHLTPDQSTGTGSGEAHALSALEAHVGEASGALAGRRRRLSQAQRGRLCGYFDEHLSDP
jgi:hypothetical protein